jgi:hypothetical protein
MSKGEWLSSHIKAVLYALKSPHANVCKQARDISEVQMDGVLLQHVVVKVCDLSSTSLAVHFV